VPLLLGWVCGSFIGFGFFAWFILWSVSLGFFSGSGVFPLGLGGPVGGNGVGFGALRGSFCIRRLLLGVSLILWRFLLCLLGVLLWVFFVG
jgi:hypothetical protein